jgi:hypothetical protein
VIVVTLLAERQTFTRHFTADTSEQVRSGSARDRDLVELAPAQQQAEERTEGHG